MNKDTFIIVDLANTFFRARHAIKGDADTKIGMALHIIFNSIRKAWQDFNGKHVVFCLEGRSWRKDVYSPYKKNRADARAILTPKEQEEDRIFWETLDIFKEFIKDKTNCSVLHHPRLEADDLIAGFIQHHPLDHHVIISSDSDFVQLISENVSQYNGISNTHITINGYFDDKSRALVDKKTGKIKEAPNPQWLLFEKCMRGDTSDNIFSAYPGVRTKSSKNKIGLIEAFEDRLSKGWAWNNLMLQRWVDHNGDEHRVLEDYERNRLLIDLTAQPDEIKNLIKESLDASLSPKDVGQVGIRLLKFCQLYNLQKISEQAQSYAEPLNAKYTTEDL